MSETTDYDTVQREENMSLSLNSQARPGLMELLKLTNRTQYSTELYVQFILLLQSPQRMSWLTLRSVPLLSLCLAPVLLRQHKSAESVGNQIVTTQIYKLTAKKL